MSIEEEWEQFDVRQVFDVLSTRDTGLTADEVAKRLEEYGANHIYRKRKPFGTDWDGKNDGVIMPKKDVYEIDIKEIDEATIF